MGTTNVKEPRLSVPKASWRLQLDCHGPFQTADSGPPNTDVMRTRVLEACHVRVLGPGHALHDAYRGNQTLCLLRPQLEKTGREI